MSRGSNVGRSMFVLAAAAGVAGLLTYTPPPTDLQAAGSTRPWSRPIVAGPFTATPASVPPIPVATTSASRAPAVSTPVTAAPPPPPPVTELPPPPPEVEAPADAPYVPPTYHPAPSATEPAPVQPDVAPPEDSGGPCALYDNLLTVLDDKELRAAVATVGCG